ncbi:MAG TPA: hypothetical protein VJM31_09535 [Vicinamibacterales bacterium]|nr:hypothetical protein [Vicinamibacterales bacterium]
MKTLLRSTLIIGALLSSAALAAAQEVPAAAPEATPAPPPAESIITTGRPITIQHVRPQDQRGINMFETSKEPGVAYKGFRVDFGAAFAAQFQSLRHDNAAAPNVVNGVNANQLIEIGNGFNNSTANLYLHAQLADGIRVQLTSYLSSRHHNETWVKDGFIQMDKSPIPLPPLENLMKYVTLKIGHFEINYGDAHFRRTDNGNAMYNPFVGNLIMDAFTTEVGAEAILRHKSVIAVGSITGGEVRGTVLSPKQRSASYIGKLGFDRQVNPNLRVRLTGSMYKTNNSASNTLYGGDRAGSRYYYVVENTAATESAQFTSGMINPAFRNKVTAFQVNPFVKFGGLEVFGLVERAKGRASAEAANREIRQYALDTIYRVGPNEELFVAARYNKVEGQLAGIAGDMGANRWQLGAGMFLTPMIMAKIEYVKQEFTGYPVSHVRHGGQFNGLMFEGVVGF